MRRERADILRTVAANSGRSAVILEKDIWVCWVLQALFSMPDPHPMAFKGGTSLSKVYRHHRAVFRGRGHHPRLPGLQRQFRPVRRRRQPEPDPAVQRTASRPSSRATSATSWGPPSTPPPSASRPTAGTKSTSATTARQSASPIRPPSRKPGGYVRSEVLLEFGGRNVIDPHEQHTIVPDIAALASKLDYPAGNCDGPFSGPHLLGEGDAHPCRMPPASVGEPSRTALPPLVRPDSASRPTRSARPRSPTAPSWRNVVGHKKVFFHAGNAKYDQCLDGRLRLVPDDDQLLALQSDYEAMRNARIVGDDAPEFDALIERLRILEADANRPS